MTVALSGFGNDLLSFVVGHGVIELSCIFIAGGAGLLIGTALLMPGDLSRGDAFKSRGMEAVRDTSQQLRERALQAQDMTVAYVKDEPIKAMLIAAATGALLMGIISMLGRSRD